MGEHLAAPTVYTIVLWNGKDLTIQSWDGSFIVRSRPELTDEQIGFFNGLKVFPSDRQVEISSTGTMTIMETPQEIEARREKKQRHARLLSQIAALEPGEAEGSLNSLALDRLKDLRADLNELEPQDPTAITSEQKRAVRSWRGK